VKVVVAAVWLIDIRGGALEVSALDPAVYRGNAES